MTEYKTDLLDLRRMDCMDLMRDLPDKHFALAIVDPPYGIGQSCDNPSASYGIRKDGTRRIPKSWKNITNSSPKYKTKEWDKSIPEENYFCELQRVSKNQIIWGGNYFPLPLTGGWVVWDKKVNEGMSFSKAELAWESLTQSVSLFRFQWAGYLKQEKCERIHPTEKPVALYRWLLANYAKQGDNILDTHMGSGSIAVACHYAGYHLTATELDQDYFDAAVERIKRETAQLTLAM